ncbi:MAG TPA: radical SAM protein, partial [Chitinophagales bacterium]|nr:radical SAM protein [Chitinophagales bacterium]
MKTKPRNYTVTIITLGCSKNVVDSEVLLGQLKGNNISASHGNGKDNANVIIINTCGFIESAKQESINTILQYADEKKAGRVEKVFVTGCLSHRYRDELQKEIPDVDGWFGTLELPGLLKRLGADYKHELIGERVLSTPSHYAYVKISEGCNRTCAFCAIPLMRGRHVSKPVETIISEAKHLASQGVKEIMLIAQELTYYGLDLSKKRMLPELLLKLSDVDGIRWIRLHYAYPGKFPLEILDVMNRSEKICRYLDL